MKLPLKGQMGFIRLRLTQVALTCTYWSLVYQLAQATSQFLFMLVLYSAAGDDLSVHVLHGL